jgi:hypothetical protein
MRNYIITFITKILVLNNRSPLIISFPNLSIESCAPKDAVWSYCSRVEIYL